MLPLVASAILALAPQSASHGGQTLPFKFERVESITLNINFKWHGQRFGNWCFVMFVDRPGVFRGFGPYRDGDYASNESAHKRIMEIKDLLDSDDMYDAMTFEMASIDRPVESFEEAVSVAYLACESPSESDWLRRHKAAISSACATFNQIIDRHPADQADLAVAISTVCLTVLPPESADRTEYLKQAAKRGDCFGLAATIDLCRSYSIEHKFDAVQETAANGLNRYTGLKEYENYAWLRIFALDPERDLRGIDWASRGWE